MSNDSVNPKAGKVLWRQGFEDEKPFMWASKTMLKRIVESSYIDPKELSTSLLVYFGLCWLASDNESNTFEASQGLIAKKCGLHKNTIKNHVPKLEKTGAVVVTRRRVHGSKEWDVHTYRLTSSRRTPKGRRETSNSQGSDKRNDFPMSHCRKGDGGEENPQPANTNTTETTNMPPSPPPLKADSSDSCPIGRQKNPEAEEREGAGVNNQADEW
jgi:hypothetical protein